MSDNNPVQMVVYFQVIQESRAQDPWVTYWCSTNAISSGSTFNIEAHLGFSKRKMIEEVQRIHGHWCQHIDFIEVDSVLVAMKQGRVWHPGAKSAVHTSAIKEIFRTHYLMGIPIKLTVVLVAKLNNIDLGALCEEAGFHRNYINITLSGKRTPSNDFVTLVKSKIGVNPWEYAEWLQPKILSQETITPSELNTDERHDQTA